MDVESLILEIVNLWPKKRSQEDKASEIAMLSSMFKSNEEWQQIKDAVEMKIEDLLPGSKIPSLVPFVLGVSPPSGSRLPKVSAVVSNTGSGGGLYGDDIDQTEALKLFEKISNIWPQNPGYTEPTESAQVAFLAAARVIPLETLEKACQAYSDSFQRGMSSQVYAKTIRKFVSDKKLVEHWYEFSKSRSNYSLEEINQFNAAYAWYPDFTNKKLKKTQEAGWVMYWRNVPIDERLDFLAIVQAYARKRRAECRSQELSAEEAIQFTKSFNSFTTEWGEALEGVALREAKADFCCRLLVSLFVKHGLNVINIWGESGDCQPMFRGVLTFYFQSESIKKAILTATKRTLEIPDETKKYGLSIKDRKTAEEQVAEVAKNPEAFAERVYQELVALKLTEMPIERKEENATA